jgi:hypothetical protein
MNRNMLAVGLALGLGLALASSRAEAGTKKFKCSASGSFVDIPIDLDSDSCFPATNGALVCTDHSGNANFSGQCSPGGGFTGQNIVEYDPVSGTSCNILGTVVPGIASCTLAGSSEQGCEFQSVGGSEEVDRDTSSGDLTFVTVSATLCVDASSGPPFNFTGSINNTITGGTGKNAGASGTASGTFHGQTLTEDAAGHGFGWFESSSTTTITTP